MSDTEIPEAGRALAGESTAAAFAARGVPGEPATAPDPDDVPMRVKSLRLPIGLWTALEDAGHPDGVSGILREGAELWLAQHGTGRIDARAEAQHALATLARLVARTAA